MPVRFPFQPVQVNPGMELYRYWGPSGYSRATFDVFVIGPTGQYCVARRAELDNASDWVVFDPNVARSLGLALPFSRQVWIGSAAGQTCFTMPPDGLVSLLVTDYREYYFLPSPPVGFWSGGMTKNVLGSTGFLQHFAWRVLNDGLSRPEVELEAVPNFPGQQGVFAVQPLANFFRQLRSRP
jgi:hypothetical protein